MAVTVRAFTKGDLRDCLAIFDANVPVFFAAEERPDFAGFLAEGPATPYLVLQQEGGLVACGGVSAEADGWAVLDWGMVAPPFQRQGLGRRLLRERIVLARAMQVRGVRLETSQKTCGFYRAMGFTVSSVIRDGLAKGLDRVAMTLAFAADKAPAVDTRA